VASSFGQNGPLVLGGMAVDGGFNSPGLGSFSETFRKDYGYPIEEVKVAASVVPFEVGPIVSGDTRAAFGTFPQFDLPHTPPMGGTGHSATESSAAGFSGYKAGEGAAGIPVIADGMSQYQGQRDTAVSDVADYQMPENASPVIPFPKKSGRDAEFERLQKIEANFEKDKALERKKQPALARSESHDVGHAEGTVEARRPKQFLTLLSDRAVEMLKKKVGL
jgi:hypothetical protein